jgi:predicted dehydrogenase
MERLRVALVGCGDISGVHIDAFQKQAERAQIVLCCDTDVERARKAAETIGDGARAVTDYAVALTDPEVDAVDLCLPHHLHAEAAVAAAQARRHILCEKPLALTPEDCDRMIAASREAGVVLLHAESMRLSEPVERADALIQEGRIGKVVGLQATWAFWQRETLNTGWRARPAEAGGGHLMDSAIHVIDALRHLGGEIVAIHAMTTQFRPELGAQSEDTGVLNFRFAGGHLGLLFACHAARGRGTAPLLTVFGTEGCLNVEVYGGDHLLMLHRPGQPPEGILERGTGWRAYHRLIEHFLDVIQRGEPLRATPEDGRENVRVVLAAYESARTGREISLSN